MENIRITMRVFSIINKATMKCKQQTANSKQQTANSKQQTANSKQQTANIIISCLLLLLVTACSTVGQKTVPNSALARRAAFALNTGINEIDITNRYTDGMYRINFTAMSNEKYFQCHVGMSAGVLSDAMCVGIDGSINGVPLWINTPGKAQTAELGMGNLGISPELLQWLDNKISCVEPTILAAP